MSVKQTLEVEIAYFMYKYNKDLLPTSFNNFFQTNSINCSMENGSITRPTTSNSNLYPIFCRINVSKQSMKYQGPLTLRRVQCDLSHDRAQCASWAQR